MDLRRARRWEWLAAVSGAVLIGVMFLHWYSGGGAAVSAWQAFSVIDVVLLLAGLGGIAVLVAAVTQRAPAIQLVFATLCVPLAFAAAVLVAIRAIGRPAHIRPARPASGSDWPRCWPCTGRSGAAWTTSASRAR